MCVRARVRAFMPVYLHEDKVEQVQIKQMLMSLSLDILFTNEVMDPNLQLFRPSSGAKQQRED